MFESFLDIITITVPLHKYGLVSICCCTFWSIIWELLYHIWHESMKEDILCISIDTFHCYSWLFLNSKFYHSSCLHCDVISEFLIQNGFSWHYYNWFFPGLICDAPLITILVKWIYLFSYASLYTILSCGSALAFPLTSHFLPYHLSL
jgi:hypothetical protein